MTATTRNKATLAVFALMLAPAFGHAETAPTTAQAAPSAASVIAPIPVVPVSYTHLTLPTILLV